MDTPETTTSEQAKQILEADRQRRAAEYQQILEHHGRRLNCVIEPFMQITPDGRIASHVRIVARVE